MAYDKLMSRTSDGLIRIKLSETVKSWKEFIGNLMYQDQRKRDIQNYKAKECQVF